jgi:hypothetical protein
MVDAERRRGCRHDAEDDDDDCPHVVTGDGERLDSSEPVVPAVVVSLFLVQQQVPTTEDDDGCSNNMPVLISSLQLVERVFGGTLFHPTPQATHRF